MKKIIFFMLLLIGLPVYAQDNITGFLSIKCFGDKNAVFTVKRLDDMEEVARVKTDRRGMATISGLPKGEYMVESENTEPFYVIIPTIMTKKATAIDNREFYQSEGFPAGSDKVSVWSLQYTVFDGHAELGPVTILSHGQKRLSILSVSLFALYFLTMYIIIKLFGKKNPESSSVENPEKEDCL